MPLDLPVQQVFKVQLALVLPELLVLKVHQDLKVQQVFKVQLALVLLVQLVLRVQLE